jgi:hypothetical protein
MNHQARLAFYYFRELYRFEARPKTKESAIDLYGNPGHPIFAVKSTSSYCSLRETDYNFHKSNSTYYADLDAARVPCMTAFYFPGREKLSRDLNKEYAKEAAEKGRLAPEVGATMFIALGGVYCSFKKEIKPFERYEMRSSVVAWDQKWIYNMTHFVKQGVDGEEIIAAAALSKYCVKKGRRTVPPGRLLEAWDMVPSQRQILTEKIKAELGDPMARSLDAEKHSAEHAMLTNLGDGPELWSWEEIELQRQRGLDLCRRFQHLDDNLYL